MRRRMGASLALSLLGSLCLGTAEAEIPGTSEPLPLHRHYDNTAVSDDTRPAQADFDGAGGSLSAQDLSAAGWTPGRTLTVQGARLTWPRRSPGEPDNVRADGQSALSSPPAPRRPAHTERRCARASRGRRGTQNRP